MRARDASVSASVSSPTLEADSMDSIDSMDEGEPVVRTAPAVSAKASHIALSLIHISEPTRPY